MSGKARNPRIWFNNLPLSRKILSITFVSSLITLFLLCSLSFLRERNYFYDRKISSLETLARILESNTTAALRFDDPDIARQYVSSLSEEPDIERVTIFDAADNVFAAYNRTQDLVQTPPPTTLGGSTDKDYILIAHEVTFGEERLGTILIEISTRSLRNSVLNLLWTNIAFLFGGLAITTALAYRLQKFITTPINELVEVTKSIASEQDYSTKATKHSDDEIGSLVDSVNQMLEAIEKRDETLRSTNSILEKTVEKRTRDLNERNKALNKAINAARAAADAKSDFLATTSHELRTPLNPIIGYVDRLMEKIEDLDSQRELQIIKNSAELLLRLIDDILEFSRIEHGDIRIQMKESNLNKCCRDATHLMSAQAKEKGLDLEFILELPKGFPEDRPIVFDSDEGRLQQVVLNLIGNAIKFTEEGRITVRVIIKSNEQGMDALKVSVEDTGIGISEEDSKKLFEPFTQVDEGLSRKYSGMGLGLAISRAFVEALGGVIDCSSELGVGSTFWFEIPIKLKHGETVATLDNASVNSIPGGNEEDDGAKSILLVDDERVNRELGASMIRSLGYHVVCAKDGLEALSLTGKQDFGLILLDIRMPKLDGFETAQALRDRSQKQPLTPIIALSAHITTEDEERCHETGMRDYLQKPLKMDTLNRCIQKWLNRKDSNEAS